MREQMIGTRRVEVPDEPGPQGRESYGRIDFEELPNTRDLGGLIGVDGRRVKPRRLLRSGALGFGSTDDLKRLRDEYRLGLVVDLRNDTELAEVPDPMEFFPDASYVHANILREETSGITQEQAARLERAQRQAREEDDPVVFMEAVYPHLLLNQAGIEGYRAFLRAVLDRDADASLWHCYVGRDRCGMASVLIEAALGVSRSDIEADYLATNLYAPRQLTIDAPASLRLIDAAWGAADREFGGMLGYITGALGLDQADIAELRARYLEPAA
ncbi:tyrosine-protein phosphatase [Collinsella vaginalis]|uniref:tyrosine-protein phosphatase n=1 Tax=Collinsella vaginalis TaxID=1870987 RepID=UPI000A26A5EC|nr:tyrosine-protein phosphatase [Collinsella vaginalis]